MSLQTEWALAVALQTMSACALRGLSLQRTQSVVDHLRMVAGCRSVPVELRAACGKLSGLWETIDLQ